MDIWKKEQFLQRFEAGKQGILFLYTPFCGTCQLAERMLGIIEKMMPELDIGKADINYLPDLAEQFKIESVPCLLLFNDEDIQEKIYAFRSVPYLFEKIKNWKA